MKKNNKGMTLVEVVISMCILGIIAAMFVTIAVSAKRQNRDNYLRSNEMYGQAAAAEVYDPNKTYVGSEMKVGKMFSSGTNNNFEMVAPFTGYNIKTNAYGYKAINTDKDRNSKDYQLKFFKSRNADLVPELDANEYWIKIVNDSGGNLDCFISTPDGRFFDTEKRPCGYEFTQIIPNGGFLDFGISPGDLGDENLFGISENEGLFDPGHSSSSLDTKFTKAGIAAYRDKNDEGELQRTVTIYYANNKFMTQAEYDAFTAGS